jgi:hypothetical protein
MKLDIIGGNASGGNMKWFKSYNFKIIEAIIYLIAFFFQIVLFYYFDKILNQ